jgi:flagellar assembly factor FliW
VGVEDPDVWVTVRTGSSPSDFSANLRAPILVAEGRGHQVINEASDAPVRAPLFAGDAVEAAA